MMARYYQEAQRKYTHVFEWDQESAVIYLGNLLWSQQGVNFITENKEGMILGSVGETWFGKNLLGKPAALYVAPEHRNGLIARALLRRFEQECKQRGAVAILWEFESGLADPVMIDGLMKSLKYEYQGTMYRKIF